MKTIGNLHLFVAALILALTTGAVKAQSRLNCGIEAGAVLSFPADHMKGSSVGWHAGVTGEYAVDGSWHVESGLRLKSKPTDGGIARIFGYWGGYEGEEYRILPCNKTNPVYLEVPVRAGYVIRLSDSFDLKISAGPYFGLGLFGKLRWSGLIDDVTYYGYDLGSDLFGKNNIMHQFEVGVSGKVALRFHGHYGISAEYTRQFNPMYKRFFSKMYNQTLSFGLSYTM